MRSNKEIKKEKQISGVVLKTDLDDNFLKSLGQLTVNYSQLENILKWICYEALDTSNGNYATIIVSELRFKSLLSVCKSILSEMNILEQFKKTFADINDVSEKRNVYIHSYYGTGGVKGNEIARMKEKNRKGELKREITYDSNDVNHLAKEMKKLEHEIFDVLKKMKEVKATA